MTNLTHQEKLTKVTEAIHKACPDLLELKTGSRFLYKDEEMIFINYSRHGYINAIHSDGFLWETAMNKSVKQLLREIKILGQPINLPEVLRAVHESNKNRKMDFDERPAFEISTYGMFLGNLYNWEEEPVFWNLTKTLDQQEEPVIDLLHNILCV